MSPIDWAAVLIVAGIVLVVWQLAMISARFAQTVAMLQSLDAEVFHLAHEQNPSYGICSDCGLRAIIRHVLPKTSDVDSVDADMFYCKNCWWMSDIIILGDENKHYKDGLSELDRMALRAGPGQL